LNEIENNYLTKEEIKNLHDQPKYYQNTEFFKIKPEEIKNC